MPHKIKKPSEVDSLAADTSKGFDETSKLPARLDRYHTAKKRALVNRKAILEHLGIPDLNEISKGKYRRASSKLRDCGNYLAFRHYFTVNKVRLHKASFCKQHLICPLCAIRRGAKSLDSYLTRYQAIKSENPSYRLSMITLTVKNGNDLEERFQHLQKSVQRVFKRRRKALNEGKSRTEWGKVHGYVGTYEVTEKGKGWHPHAHIMVLHTESFSYKALQSEWKEITGDSHVLNVTAALHPDEPERDFLEVFKYAVKFSELSPDSNIHAWRVLQGKRLLFSGGAFRGVVVPEKLEDVPLDELPFFELFYQYTKYGYTLTGLSRSDLEPANTSSHSSGSEPAERAKV